MVADAPDHDQAWQSLGEIAHELGNEDEARKALVRAQTLRGEMTDGPAQPGFLKRLFSRR